MPNFKDYTLMDVRESKPKRYDTAEEAKDFYEGNHWRGGDGWVGPRPRVDSTEHMFIMAEISRQFCSKNVIKNVVDRYVNALLASEPKWMFVPERILKDDEEPSDEEESQSLKAEQIVNEWWDESRAVEKIREAVKDCLVQGRGSLRVFVPSGKLVKTESGAAIVPRSSLEDGVLKFLRVESGTADVFTDEDTTDQASVLIKQNRGGLETVEFSYIDESGNTVVKTWHAESESEISMALGGRLIAKSIDLPPLITRQVLSSQKSLNMSLTMMDRNSIQGGFLERIILNAEPPGKWETDTSGNKTFVPAPFKVGAGTTSFLSSRVIESTEAGDAPIVLPADIRWKDPVSPDNFIKTVAQHRENIYEETCQMHALISGDATASAISRVQARADFIDSLSALKKQTDDLIRWLIEIVIDHACYFAGTSRKDTFGLVRAACDITPSAGPLLPEERDAVMSMVEKEMISLETAMQLLGVEDVDAERGRIAQETASPTPGRKLKLIEGLAKAGYSFAEDQLGDLDKEIGVPVRDTTVVDESQAMDLEMQRERLRQQKAASDPNDADPNAKPAGK